MQLHSNTILITGGASGIGLAMAERFLQAGSEVIVCGRRAEALQKAKEKNPKLHTHICDVAKESERIELFHWASQKFPKLNVLINNAGIQRRVQIAANEAWKETQAEIAINLEAPIHLSALFVDFLSKQERPALVNVTSGLSFSPLGFCPVYCATKAALHSFTLSLRHQIAQTALKVIEIIPPAVNTDLGGVGQHDFGAPLKDFTDAIFERLAAGDLEIPYGMAVKASQASRAELNEIFIKMNAQIR